MRQDNSEKGFTLIELLTVMTVLSVLSVLAISQFDHYRRRAFDSRAEHDMRAAITCQEAHFAENEEYVTCTNTTCETAFSEFKLSGGVQLELQVSADGNYYTASSLHPYGVTSFEYDSETGRYTASS